MAPKIHSPFPLLCLFITLTFYPAGAYAIKLHQTVNALTAENIEEFIDDMTALSTGRHDLPPPDVSAYLKTHLHDKGHYTSAITYDIPGYPAQDKEITLNKEQFIDSLITDSNDTNDFETTVKIENIDIKRGGKAATIHTVSADKGTLYLPDGNGQDRALPVKGSSKCEQKFILSHQDTIQLVKAECVTEIHFNPFGNKELDDYDF